MIFVLIFDSKVSLRWESTLETSPIYLNLKKRDPDKGETLNTPLPCPQLSSAENRVVLPQGLTFWLFECKEIMHPTATESKPDDSTMFYEREDELLNLLGRQHSLRQFKRNEEHVEPCCVVLCRTMQGWKICARRQEKHALDRAWWGDIWRLAWEGI